jgi:PAS domain S-box-containing protein
MDSSTSETPEQIRAEIVRLYAKLAQLPASRVPAAISTDPTVQEETWFEQVSDAIYVTDALLCIQRWNRAAELTYGWPRAEVIGRPITEIIPPVHFVGETQQSVIDTIMTAGAWRGEFSQRTRGGRELVIEGSLRALYDEGGVIVGYVGINRDVSARAQAEQALRDHAEVLDQAQVLVRDPESRIILWTRGAEQLYGYTKDEALGQVSHDLLRTIFPEPLEQIEATLAQTGRWSGKLIHQTRAGQTVVVASQQLLERDTSGQPRRIIEANTNMTALEYATTRLHILAEASRAFAAAGMNPQDVLDQVASFATKQLCAGCIIRLLSDDRLWLNAVAIFDHDPVVQAEAQALLDSLRISVASPNPAAIALRRAESQLFSQLEPVAIREVVSPPVWQAFNRLQPHSGMLVPLLLHDEPIGVLAFIRHDSAQLAFTADDLRLAEDLADRAALAIGNARLFEQAQQEIGAREQAEAALIAEHERVVQIKNQFMATMSHELRTPLNAVLGQTQLIAMGIHGPLNERQVKAIQTIDRSGQHLLALINDILDYVKLESDHVSLDITAIAVEPLCQDVMRLVAREALAKQIVLTITLDGGATLVAADERRLQQILVNLLSNAMKFTPLGGEAGLRVRGDAAQQTITFTVWDTGIGIAEADFTRLFQPFSQLDSRLSRQYEGTGLGLALVRRLVDAHGGSIALESTPGQGSQFSVTLPWGHDGVPATAAPALLAETLPDLSWRDGEAPLILLVEDNEPNIVVLQDALAAQGYALAIARDGIAALERARATPPALMVLDIQLPGMSGLEVIRQVRADDTLRTVPIVALTALVMPGDRERCLEAGANAYLAKPVQLTTLLKTIAAQLGYQ